MLTVTNLSIHVKRTKETLVRSVSFSVENRETLGLIGESGSGKSMTLRCIAGIVKPDEGYIERECPMERERNACGEVERTGWLSR